MDLKYFVVGTPLADVANALPERHPHSLLFRSTRWDLVLKCGLLLQIRGISIRDIRKWRVLFLNRRCTQINADRGIFSFSNQRSSASICGKKPVFCSQAKLSSLLEGFASDN
jgi:hypothetical protein